MESSQELGETRMGNEIRLQKCGTEEAVLGVSDRISGLNAGAVNRELEKKHKKEHLSGTGTKKAGVRPAFLFPVFRILVFSVFI